MQCLEHGVPKFEVNQGSSNYMVPPSGGIKPHPSPPSHFPGLAFPAALIVPPPAYTVIPCRLQLHFCELQLIAVHALLLPTSCKGMFLKGLTFMLWILHQIFFIL